VTYIKLSLCNQALWLKPRIVHENAPLQKYAMLSEDRYGQSLPRLKQDGRSVSN
jgi:hypothetical protein